MRSLFQSRIYLYKYTLSNAFIAGLKALVMNGADSVSSHSGSYEKLMVLMSLYFLHA